MCPPCSETCGPSANAGHAQRSLCQLGYTGPSVSSAPRCQSGDLLAGLGSDTQLKGSSPGPSRSPFLHKEDRMEKQVFSLPELSVGTRGCQHGNHGSASCSAGRCHLPQQTLQMWNMRPSMSGGRVTVPPRALSGPLGGGRYLGLKKKEGAARARRARSSPSSF